MSSYIVVEGTLERFILEQVLPEEVCAQSTFVVGHGYTPTLSKVRSLLVSSDRPVSVIVETETTNQARISEKEDFIRQLLRQLSSPEHFHVILAIPDMEVVFFQDRSLLETLVGRSVSDEQWETGQTHPKEVLQKIWQTMDLQKALKTRLTSPVIQQLRETDLIQQIIRST